MTVTAKASVSSPKPSDKKKKKKGAQQTKPHIIVEYKGEIDEERIEEIGSEVDELVDKFEQHGDQFILCNSMIRKRKIEGDLLLVIEKLRDICHTTVRGDKRELDCIFGGNCVRIGKTFYLLEILDDKMSNQVKSDQRWAGLKTASDTVKEVLESMGHFKAWRPGGEEIESESSSSDEELTEEERHEKWVRKLLKIVPKRLLEDFKKIEDITTVEELLNIKVDEKYQYRDWMVWSVHRVYLNDPTLVELSFANMQMPLPTVDSKVAPKLCKAIGKNSCLERLYLQNSTLQSAEAELLAEALKENKCLKELNIEGNNVDVTSLASLADSLKCNKSLLEFRIGSQAGNQGSDTGGLGSKFEETLGLAMSKNDSIVRIGIDLFSPNWRNLIDSKILRNIDRQKRMQRNNSTYVNNDRTFLPMPKASQSLIIPPSYKRKSNDSNTSQSDKFRNTIGTLGKTYLTKTSNENGKNIHLSARNSLASRASCGSGPSPCSLNSPSTPKVETSRNSNTASARQTQLHNASENIILEESLEVVEGEKRQEKDNIQVNTAADLAKSSECGIIDGAMKSEDLVKAETSNMIAPDKATPQSYLNQTESSDVSSTVERQTSETASGFSKRGTYEEAVLLEPLQVDNDTLDIRSSSAVSVLSHEPDRISCLETGSTPVNEVLEKLSSYASSQCKGLSDTVMNGSDVTISVHSNDGGA